MNAISLWQPWASLVAAGIKRIETRSWGTNFRGPIAIHAAKYRLKKREREAMLVDLQAMTDLYFAKMGTVVRAARSACVFCPFKSKDEWRLLKKSAVDWDRACAFDDAVAARYERDGHFSRIRLQPFITQDLVRLRELDLTDYSLSQRRLGFDNECAGVCGV